MQHVSDGREEEEFSISWKEQRQQLQVQNFPEDKNVFFIVHITPSMLSYNIKTDSRPETSTKQLVSGQGGNGKTNTHTPALQLHTPRVTLHQKQ